MLALLIPVPTTIAQCRQWLPLSQIFAQVMTTVAFRIPTHRALRGGMMIGADVISVAELVQ